MADGKWIEGLTGEMELNTAAKIVLAARFKVVQHYLPLAVEKASEDPEYVHQLRVGTRRLAAALRVFADCLPRKHLKAAKRSLRLIRKASGEARDWDVFFLGLPSTKPLAATTGKPALDFLIGYALGEREAAQIRLVEASQAAQFLSDAEQLVQEVQAPKGDKSSLTLENLAARELGELLLNLTTAVEANPSAPADLHKLRIMAKRVRYALEIFVDCFPPLFKERVYPAVEKVQTVLGEVQDATVGLQRLAWLRDRLKKSIPGEWPRLQKGVEGVMHSMRSKIPAGRKAFQKWRQEWNELVVELKEFIVLTTITA